MRYNRGLLFSTVVISLLATGCVKPTEQVSVSAPATGIGSTVVYNDPAMGTYDTQAAGTVIYENSAPIIYEDPASTSSSTVYGESVSDGTVISTGHYEPAVGSPTPASSSGPYSDPYSSGGTSGGGEIYSDPYGSSSSSSNPYDSVSSGGSSSSQPYTIEGSYSSGGGGIHLQIAALKDYFAAEEFKNSLSLDPKYSAYVKKGPINKVIVTGIPSRAEAKRLAANRFPGAFIVGGSETSGGGSYSSSSTSAPYSPPVSSGASGALGANNGIGVQVGAFSTREAARNAAERAGGRYTALVKTAQVRGKTWYKAILIGFSTKQEARSAIASGQFGDAFLVTNAYK